jgi:hypothetical protein
MKLYELSEAYCSVLEELSEPLGDGQDEARFQALLQGLGDAFDEKVLSIAKIIRSLESDIGSIAGEVERLQGRRRHLAGRVEWLKRYLVGEMELVGREKVRGSTMTVSLGKAPPSCEVVSVEEVPEEYRRVKVEVDRAGILEHFRSTGEVVPGTAVIADRRYVRIS